MQDAGNMLVRTKSMPFSQFGIFCDRITPAFGTHEDTRKGSMEYFALLVFLFDDPLIETASWIL
jgi:hypothetical protein